MLRRGLLPAASAVALLMVSVPAAASAASAPLTWSAPVPVDTQPPFGSPAINRGLACVGSSQCFNTDGSGNVLTSTNPTGGQSAWHVASNVPGLPQSLTCASGPTFCLAFDGQGNIATSSDPAGGAGAWTVGALSGAQDVLAASCASSSLCAIVDGGGNVWTSTTPSDASSWSSAHISSHGINSISCPTTTLCVAADQISQLLISTNPTGGAPAWSANTTALSGESLNAISCTTTPSTYCWGGSGSDVLHSHASGPLTDAWTKFADVLPAGGGIVHLACSTTACAAGTTTGDVVGTSNPDPGTSAATDWKTFTGDATHFIWAVSCLSGSSTCVATDGDANIIGTTAPSSGNWSIAPVDGASGLSAVACPSPSMCVIPDNAGAVLTSTNPAGGAGAWQRTFLENNVALIAASCPSVTLCVLGDSHGNILTSANPAGGVGAWSQPVNIGQRVLTLSCPVVSLCVGIDGADKAFVSTNPAGGAGAWSSASIDPGQQLQYVTCPTASLCVALDAGGILTSTNPTGGPAAWSRAQVDPGQFFDAVSCASASLCVAVDDNGTAFVSTNPTGGASAWQQETLDPSANGFADVGCRPGPVCVAVDFIGNVWTSTNPAGGASAWSAPQDIDGTNTFNAVKCSPGLLCVAGDINGNLVVGRPPAPTSTAGPSVLGTAKVGQQLTASPGAWTGDPVSFGYQWAQCDLTGASCARLLGATGQTYTVHPGDAGHTLRVLEFATNAGGSSAPATSAPTQAVAPANTSAAPINTTAPHVSGAAIPGHSLHASTGKWLGTVPIGFSYQWQSCRRLCDSIAGATRSSYRVRKRDVGARIRVVLTATNGGGHGFAVSLPTAPVLTIKQIRAIVLHAAVPHGGAARFAAILAHQGFTVSFKGLIPGRLRVLWKSGPTVISTGTLSFKGPGRHKLRLKLTRVGRARLGPGKGFAATVVFIPAGGGRLAFSERFGLS